MKRAFRKLLPHVFMMLLSCVLVTGVFADEEVFISDGIVRGVSEQGLEVYKGIPFAAPPVGELRWKAPQPVTPWQGVLNADHFGPACPQIPFPSVNSINNSVGQMSEDCLYLNVWVPQNSEGRSLPVMVWIHGGGFAIGATTIENYSGDQLAHKDVIVVSIAYRLGALGFMAHPELVKENEMGISGNYGLLDQIAGLKWVRKNIAAFGGDPDNVTIFGESAGAISVSMLSASPLTRGLFKRAISESGGSFGPVTDADNRGNGVQTLAAAERQGLAFAERMGAENIAALRAMPADKFLADPLANMGGFWPVCDGYVIVDDQYKLYSQGRYNDVDVMIGTNSNEGSLFVHNVDADKHKASLKKQFGSLVDEALSVYPATNDEVALQSSRNIFRDYIFAWPSWAWARLQKKTGHANVFVYYFDQPQPHQNRGEAIVGAAHSDEVNYVFGHVDENINFDYTAEDKTLSSIMMDYWVAFARTGKPQVAGLPEWPQFDNSAPTVMHFKEGKPSVGPLENRSQLEFFEMYIKAQRETR